MIFQLDLPAPWDFIVWLIIGTIILGLFIYLAVWLIVSKTKAKDRLLMIFIAAFLGIFLLPIVAGAIGSILNAIGGIPALLPWGENNMGGLVPIVQYLLFIIIIKFLISLEWGNAVWITLIALFLLFLLYSFFPVLYAPLGTPVS
jgi:hypothetical protein